MYFLSIGGLARLCLLETWNPGAEGVSSLFHVQRDLENEYKILGNLPIHKNVVRLWAFFYDRLTNDLPGVEISNTAALGNLSLILVMEYLPMNLQTLSTEYRENGRLTFEVFLDWSRQLAEASHFLSMHCVVHRDMKLDNVLVSQDGRQLKVCDFGQAIQTEHVDLKEPYHQRLSVGGNTAHLAPEIFSATRAASRGSHTGLFINYGAQPVWELAVLMHELATGQLPFKDHGRSYYERADVPDISLPPSATNQDAAQRVGPELQALVQRMLSFEPAERPTIFKVLETLTEYAKSFPLR